MARLTDRRFEQAKPILDRYRDKLAQSQNHSFHAGFLEKELRELWRMGYQELKGVMKDLSRRPGYTHLAAYYMEHSNAGSGVAEEFKDTLAALYGVRHYHADDREEKQRAFWAAFGTSGGETPAG